MQQPASGHATEWNVLFTCVGRRVELVQSFRRAADALGIRLVVHGSDVNWLAPAMHLVDRGHLLPPIRSGEYIDALLALVRRCRIRLLIPSIDPDLPPLAEARPRFEEAGCCVMVSDAPVITICADKLKTFEVLTAAAVDTPRTWTLDEALSAEGLVFPLYLKPRFGSAAKGNYVLRDHPDLETLGRRIPDPIVQEFVDGVEHTIDVYCGFDGVPRCAVPRRRLEVRNGEVSKAVTIRDPAIIAAGLRVARALKGCRGVITVQTILTADGRVRVIEINPRFGGGAPLAIRAGADFPKWMLTTLIGSDPHIAEDCFQPGLAMLRYDQSVFITTDPSPIRGAASDNAAGPSCASPSGGRSGDVGSPDQ